MGDGQTEGRGRKSEIGEQRKLRKKILKKLFLQYFVTVVYPGIGVLFVVIDFSCLTPNLGL